MSGKVKRLEARLTASQRSRIERAASLADLSASAFVVEAAVDRADILIAARSSTEAPGDYFDRLLASLDKPDRAPGLRRAAQRAATESRIAGP